MKTIYSLKEFNEMVGEIATSINETYFSVRVEISNGRLSFHCYINKYDYYEGRTMEESLEKLKNAVRPSAAPNIDVEIDFVPTAEPVID